MSIRLLSPEEQGTGNTMYLRELVFNLGPGHKFQRALVAFIVNIVLFHSIKRPLW